MRKMNLWDASIATAKVQYLLSYKKKGIQVKLAAVQRRLRLTGNTQRVALLHGNSKRLDMEVAQL